MQEITESEVLGLARQFELLLVKFLLSSRVPLLSTFEEVHVLLFCHLRVVCVEVTAVVEVGDHRSSEGIELLFGLVNEALVLVGKVPFLGDDLPPFTLAHLLNHLNPLRLGVFHLGAQEGSIL